MRFLIKFNVITPISYNTKYISNEISDSKDIINMQKEMNNYGEEISNNNIFNSITSYDDEFFMDIKKDIYEIMQEYINIYNSDKIYHSYLYIDDIVPVICENDKIYVYDKNQSEIDIENITRDVENNNVFLRIDQNNDEELLFHIVIDVIEKGKPIAFFFNDQRNNKFKELISDYKDNYSYEDFKNYIYELSLKNIKKKFEE